MGEVGLLNHVGFVIEPSRAPRPGCALFDLLPGSSLAGLAAARILSRLPLLLCYHRLLTLEGCCPPKYYETAAIKPMIKKRALRYDYESKQKGIFGMWDTLQVVHSYSTTLPAPMEHQS